MSFRIVVRPQADIEILEAAEFYEKVEPGLGLDFLDKLEEAKNSVIEHPQHYFNISLQKKQRRFRLNRFPYLIIYEIIGDTVVVIAVRHAKRKPSK